MMTMVQTQRLLSDLPLDTLGISPDDIHRILQVHSKECENGGDCWKARVNAFASLRKLVGGDNGPFLPYLRQFMALFAANEAAARNGS